MVRSATRYSGGLKAAVDWAAFLDEPVNDLDLGRGCSVRHWRDTDPEMIQPALDAHLVVIHLGGPKRVSRRGEGASLVADMAADAISIVPSGSAYAWSTVGPIDYAHFYLPPLRLERATEAIFDRNGRGVALVERLGCEDDLLRSLFHAILAQAAGPNRDPLYLETLSDALLGRLLREHSNLAWTSEPAPYTLAPRRLAEVTDFIEGNLAAEISLEQLAEVARLSRFHFVRAFARATGETPHAFLVTRRLEAAKAFLRTTEIPIDDVARRCGFRGGSHFATRFRRAFGFSPRAYRRDWSPATSARVGSGEP